MDINKWHLQKGEPEPIQIEIIDEILDAINTGYKNIILDAGTGIGKSPIATTIASHFEKSYIIAGVTNQLLTQYKKDFHHILAEIKGRTNYQCQFEGTCDECIINEFNKRTLQNYYENKKHNKNIEKPKLEKKCENCQYNKAFKEAMENQIILTNYDYLYTAGNYAGTLPERDLIIFDEAHNLEGKLLSNLTYSLNRKRIYKDYQIDIFDGIVYDSFTLKEIQDEPEYWINLLKQLIEIDQEKMNKYVNKHYNDVTGEDFEKLKTIDPEINKLSQRISKYEGLNHILKEEEWIICTPQKKDILKDQSHISQTRKFKGLQVEFKPLHVSEYSNQLLRFGETRIFMSGTILSKENYCQYIGIDPDETKYIYKKSPFPVEHRPIVRDYVTMFNRKNWQSPKGLKKIRKILKKHGHDKGVIHVSSKKQAEWLIKNLNVQHNFYGCWGEGETRDQIINEYITDNTPAILIGPAIKDGVDLPNDLCRFQIIYKLPHPNLGDRQISKRFYSAGGKEWYAYHTITSLIQAYGRGIRNKNDYCTCYVLDGSLERLLTNPKHKRLFNQYFLEAIQGLDLKRKKRIKIKDGE